LIAIADVHSDLMILPSQEVSSADAEHQWTGGITVWFKLETLSIGSEAAPLWGLRGPFQLF